MHKYSAHAIVGCIVISKENPNHVLDCDLDFLSLLGYRPHEVVGRSIKFLFGPETDIAMILSAIKNASIEKPSRIDVVVYGREGDSQSVVLSCSPHKDSPERCRISI